MEMINYVLGYKNMKIYQNTDFFSFSLDSIILANFSTIRLRDKKIVDFCTGNAIVPLIMSRRTKSRIIGVEIQKKLCDLAKKSINQNKLSDYIEIVNSDIKDFSINNCNSFDLVLCNPPYFKNEEKSIKNLNYEKMVARHEVLIDLNGVVDCAKRVLKDNGIFITSGIIHDRVEMVCEKLEATGFEVIEKNRDGEWNCIVAKLK